MVYAPCLELIGLAPLEANACRLPVVAVAEGSVRETIVDGVYGLRVQLEQRAVDLGIERLVRDRKLATGTRQERTEDRRAKVVPGGGN